VWPPNLQSKIYLARKTRLLIVPTGQPPIPVKSQAPRFVPSLNLLRCAQALASVSCTRSSPGRGYGPWTWRTLEAGALRPAVRREAEQANAEQDLAEVWPQT